MKGLTFQHVGGERSGHGVLGAAASCETPHPCLADRARLERRDAARSRPIVSSTPITTRLRELGASGKNHVVRAGHLAGFPLNAPADGSGRLSTG
jgi:hypothetical protein